MTPKVSVVIPVFNRQTAVLRAIDSVLAQTVQDFEVIVVDDASTDETAAEVTAIPDPRIRLVRHDRRRGGSAARNSGIRASTGPYVAFLDSDDEWLPSKLERQLQVFEQAGDDLGLVYTSAEWVYPHGTVRIVRRRYPELAHSLLAENVIGETSLGMVRRQVLEELGGFDETLPSCQDMDLWLRICQRYRADVVPEPLVRVTKSDDKGRITNNIANGLRGRALFRDKHREQMVTHGVLHIHLRTSGWWQHWLARNPKLARGLYLQSMRVNPFAPFTYVLLIAAWLPISWLDAMARCRRFLVAWFKSKEGSGAADSTPLTSVANAPKDSAAS